MPGPVRSHLSPQGLSAEAAALLAEGRQRLAASDAGGAATAFQALAVLAPQWPDLPELLAAAYRRDARYGEAIALADGVAAPSEQLLFEVATSRMLLGDAAGSLADWDALIARAPGLAAAWYGSHGPALELSGWPEAARRLERAAACPKANGKYRALHAAYDVLAGRPPGAYSRRHAHLVDSASALLPHLASGWRLFGVSASLLRWALGQARQPGLVLEFGVRRGASLLVLAESAGQEVHGFDSFEGLPEAWNGSPRGVLTTGRELPPAADGIRLHPGWFEDTVAPFLAAHAGPVRFANLDSDIYSSTRTVLCALAGRVVSGTVLVFDEFIGNRSWRDDEYRAFHEFAAEQGLRHSVIAVNPACKQVAIRVE